MMAGDPLSLFFAHVLRVLNASNHHRRFLRTPAWWVGDRSLGTLSWWVLLAVGGGSGVSPLFRWRLGALSCLVSNYSTVNVNGSGSFVLVGTSRNQNARAVQSCFSRRHKCLEHRNCIILMSQNHEPQKSDVLEVDISVQGGGRWRRKFIVGMLKRMVRFWGSDDV